MKGFVVSEVIPSDFYPRISEHMNKKLFLTGNRSRYFELKLSTVISFHSITPLSYQNSSIIHGKHCQPYRMIVMCCL